MILNLATIMTTGYTSVLRSSVKSFYMLKVLAFIRALTAIRAVSQNENAMERILKEGVQSHQKRAWQRVRRVLCLGRDYLTRVKV